MLQPGDKVQDFNLKKAEKAICSYSRSTGIRSFIIDAGGNIVSQTGDCRLCSYCRVLRDSSGKKRDCSSVHLYGSYQAERYGGRYIFFCAMGMVHWASPITNGNAMAGAMLGGPVLMIDPDEFLLEDLMKENGIAEDQLKDLKKHVDNIPVIPPDVVSSLSELLYFVSSGVSENTAAKSDEKSQYYELHSGISESIHYIKNLSKNDNETNNYPFEKERELLSKIALGDRSASQKILNDILGYIFFSSGQNYEVIKARVLELVVLLSRAAVEGGADSEEIFGLNYRYLSDVHSFKTVEEITFWLSKIMSRFTDCVFNLADVRHKDTIFKAVDYIKRHYMERITLEKVAGHVYLTSSYFSKIFKSEMKCTFVSYINKIRINAGKKLLLDISIPLTEVSSLLGFEDQSYFTKVFKKSTGVTPGKFRESRGELNPIKINR